MSNQDVIITKPSYPMHKIYADLNNSNVVCINYNKELHEKVSKSLVNLKNGVPQIGENLDDEKKGIISSLLKKEKITTVSTTLNFFDMPNQLLPEK